MNKLLVSIVKEKNYNSDVKENVINLLLCNIHYLLLENEIYSIIKILVKQKKIIQLSPFIRKEFLVEVQNLNKMTC
jgi:hypothetical protein